MTHRELRGLNRRELLELLIEQTAENARQGGLESADGGAVSAMTAAANLPRLERELQRETYRRRFSRVLRSTLYTLIVASACVVLVVVLWMPVLKIYGSSMVPTLHEGEIVVALKSTQIKPGHVVGVYYGSKLLVKRCIATAGQWVSIDESGNVYVNEVMLEEPYVQEKTLGECDIEFPYQVPENTIFVMGDHRQSSIDSRSAAVGCISLDDMAGKIMLCVWPIRDFRLIQ